MSNTSNHTKRILTDTVIRDAVTRAHYERARTFQRVFGKLGRRISSLVTL